MSRYDREAGVLLVPTQMPMPFNSSADDFLYLVDEQEDEGWLLSSRGLVAGRLGSISWCHRVWAWYEG